MKRIMAICDEMPLYAQRLAEYVNRKGQIPFTALSFSTVDLLHSYLEEQHADVLLIGEEVADPEVLGRLAGQVILLHGGYRSREDTDWPAVFKYQSSENLLREVMRLCQADLGISGGTGGESGTITGVYSPVNRCGKTSFSVVYAATIARENRTLYINLEDCSGFSRLLAGAEESGSLTDVLYYFKQQMLTPVKIASVIHSMGELDYIPPVRYPEDLCSTDAGELARMLKHLAGVGGYHTLVADFGQLGKKAAQVLEVCDVIYMPTAEDMVSAAKVEEFETYLRASQRAELCSRLHKLSLPPVKLSPAGGLWIEQLMWGELGDYVRKLVRGGESTWE